MAKRLGGSLGMATACCAVLMWCLVGGVGAAWAGRMQLPAGWTAFQGREVVVPHPPGWQVRELGQGGWVGFLPGAQGGATAVALVRPLEIQGDMDMVLANLGQAFPDYLPGASSSQARMWSQEPQVVSCRVDYQANGDPFVGQALGFAAGNQGVVYAWTAQPAAWPAQQTVMRQMLTGFFYRAAPGSAQASSGGADQSGPGLPAMTTFTDPREQAFSCPAPQGWQTQGGLARLHAVDVRPEVLTVSPDNAVLIRLGDAQIPPMALPAPMMPAEGQWYSPGYGMNMLVMRYLPGDQFITQFYLPQSFQQFSPQQINPRPDSAQKIAQIYAGVGLNIQVHAGEVYFTAQTPQGERQGYLFCQTVMTQLPGAPGMGMWNVERIYGYLAAPGREAQAQAVLREMVGGFQINPAWAQRQAQTSGQVSGIVSRTSQEINQIIHDTFQFKQASQDRVNQRFDQYIRDKVEVVDPATGQRFEVDSGGSYYWRLGQQDAFVATQTADAPRHPHYWLRQMELVN